MNGLYIDSVRLNYDKAEQNGFDKYPLNIRCIKNLNKIDFKNRVTFLVGENGIGKSTFIEALALKVGLNPEGGTQNTTFSTYDDYSHRRCCNYFGILSLPPLSPHAILPRKPPENFRKTQTPQKND